MNPRSFRVVRAATSLLTLLLLAGCGSEPGTSTSEGPAPDGSQPGFQSETGPATGGSDVAPPATGQTPSRKPSFSTPYFPLQEGLRWEYRTMRNDGTPGTSCGNDGSPLIQTLVALKDGSFEMDQNPNCFGADAVYLEKEGDIFNEAYLSFDFPAVLGKGWKAGGISGAAWVWEAQLDKIEVQGTTYEDCWRSKQVGHENTSTLCRDVGLVVSTFKAWGYDLRYELVKKSF